MNLKLEKKVVFSAVEVVALATNDKVKFCGGKKGEMEIIRVNNQYIEVKFFFTATSTNSNQKIEVADRFFRIPRP